jgi:class 3 adenylate cyclase/tetratricopeptide (TPR) repeat protein
MICVRCDHALPEQARFCPACGTPATPAAGAEGRKLVTVVFCDLVGSTELSEALDPETLRSVILRYFAAMRARIEEHGGTVEKFIGDAVMAVFGVPVMHEDDARRAAAAALGMLDALADLNADLAPTLGVRLRVRIGIHTGQAVTSPDVSTRQAMASGETLNIAARLEQNAGPGEILIGPVTRQAIGPTARTEALGPLRLKGKQEPLMTYRLLGIGEDDPALLRRFDLPFVGRVEELAALDRELDAVAAGDGSRLVVVSGEAGIGKTRLAQAWLDGVERRHSVGAGRCRPYGELGSLAALAGALRRLLATPAGRGVDDAPALAVLHAGLLEDGTPGPALDSTCVAVARVLASVSRPDPVVLVLDDCQWAGDLLLDVLDRLARLAARAAVLLVCLSRPDLADRRPDWPAAPSRTLVLPALTAADCEAMVAGMPEVSAHLATDLTPILEKAAGNPFYLEQLLAATGDADPAAELPPSLLALLGARIDALHRPERHALELASILGREFVPSHVGRLADAGPDAGLDAPAIRSALAGLRRRRLVESTVEPDSEPGPAAGSGVMRFHNVLVHEVTYQGMAKRTRADRHQRAAEVLADPQAPAVTVAAHLEHAYRYRVELGLRDDTTDGLRRRAAELLTAAGQRALRRSDLGWAETLLRRATALYQTGEPGWADATRQLGEVTVATGRLDEGRGLLGAVLDHSADPVQTAHARLALAVFAHRPTTGATADVARAVLPVFEAAGDELGQARARVRLAQHQQVHGRHADALALLASGLRHATHGDAEPERALALGAIGVSLWRGPTPVPAAIACCRELLSQHGAPRPAVRVTLNCPLAVLLALDGQVDRAREHLVDAARCADELGYAEGRVVLPIFGAAVESLAGRPERALASLEEAARVVRDLAAYGLLGDVLRDAARLLLDQDDPRRAADRLAELGDDRDLLPTEVADLAGLRARVAAARGDVGAAVRLAERAVAAAAATDSPIVAATAWLDRALVEARLGRPEPAAASADRARRRFASKGHRPGVRQATEVLRRLAGDPRPTPSHEEAT